MFSTRTGTVFGLHVASGVWKPMLERTLVLNLPHGPWQGHAFHGKLKATAEEICTVSTSQDPVFLHMFEGTAMRTSPCQLTSVPSAMSRRCGLRWARRDVLRLWARGFGSVAGMYSIFSVLTEQPNSFSKMPFFLVHIGIRERYWQSVFDSPLCCERATGADMAALEPGAFKSNRPSSPSTIKDSNKELNALRGARNNSIELVVHILSNVLNNRVLEVVAYVIEPCRIIFGA